MKKTNVLKRKIYVSIYILVYFYYEEYQNIQTITLS